MEGAQVWHIDERAVAQAEDLALRGSGDFMEPLRAIPLDSFAELVMRMPDSRWPGLSSRLPSMAAEEVQQSWTGATGATLTRQSVGFVRMLSCSAFRLTGRGLAAGNMLDFGCGWGRLLRLLPWFAPAEAIHGCDPWDASIELCRRHGIWGRLALSDYLPESLPFGDTRFDVIFAFSVFTHTSARALKTALAALRRRISPAGLLVVTIRPLEYWRMAAGLDAGIDPAAMEEAHRRDGFAFTPHHRPPIDGDITYGDASMTLAYLAGHDGWQVAGYDHLIDDVLQVPVFLRPA